MGAFSAFFPAITSCAKSALAGFIQANTLKGDGTPALGIYTDVMHVFVQDNPAK